MHSAVSVDQLNKPCGFGCSTKPDGMFAICRNVLYREKLWGLWKGTSPVGSSAAVRGRLKHTVDQI